MSDVSNTIKEVKKMLKLPQHLCKNCGQCCKIATFKDWLNYDEVKKLAEGNGEPSQVTGANDFLTVFTPFKTTADARKVAPDFVEAILHKLNKKDDEVSFFYCKFVDSNSKCLIHEDRPTFCRVYPMPHEKTFYFSNCGFEKQSKENWAKIVQLLEDLENKKK